MEEPLSLDEAFIEKLTGIILDNLDNERFGVEELSHQMGMSHTTLHRKLRHCIHKSVSQFIREVRLQKAHEMLVQNLGNVSEISYKVGFGSPTYFNKCFHEYYGYPPGEVKKIESGIKNQNDNKPDLLHLSKLMPLKDSTMIGSKRERNYRNLLAVSLAIVAGPLLIWFLYSAFFKSKEISAGTGSAENHKSIAVLPFKNLSADADNEYFADGVTIDIRDHLSRIKGLRVISATTSDHFRGSTLTIPEIAKKLGVDYVLEGSAQKDNNRTRVSVKLVDARRDRNMLSETFDRDLSDIFSVQSEIAQIVAAKLEAALSAEEIEQIEKIPTQSTEAHIFYLKGRYFWNLRTKEGLLRSVEYFERSIAADPVYAVAYAGLADAYYTLAHNDGIPAADGFRKAKEIALKALELDPGLAEAHAIVGGVYAWGEWRWEKAREEYLRTIELNPNYSTAYFYYAELLELLGENEEARLQLNNALELDPLSRAINYNNMLFYYNQGKFHEALEAWNEFNEMGLTFFNPYPFYFFIYMYLGEDSLAYEVFKNFLLTNIEGLESDESFQQMYKLAGPMGILEWMNNQKVDVTKPSEFYYYAKRCAIIGEISESLDWLEKAFQAGYVGMPYIYNSYDFRNLRNEPRFRAILRQMNFPEYKSQAPGSD